MEIAFIIVGITVIIIVVQAYSNSTKVEKAVEQGRKEVLDYLSMNLSYDLEQVVSIIDFDQKIEKGEIYVSGPYDIKVVKKAANSYIRYQEVIEKTINRIFEKYAYAPKYSLLNSEYKDKILNYCNVILNKKD